MANTLLVDRCECKCGCRAVALYRRWFGLGRALCRRCNERECEIEG